MFFQLYLLFAASFNLVASFNLLLQRDNPPAPECEPADNPQAPCVSISHQQYNCRPLSNTLNGNITAQSCLCDSEFFQNWVGCQDCLLYHGTENLLWYDAWVAQITLVSSAYCYGTPTAYFPDVFQSMTYAMPTPTVSGGYTNQSPGNAAVSLYYTATGDNQGSGPSTGELYSNILRFFMPMILTSVI
jgi:hypothetical protein